MSKPIYRSMEELARGAAARRLVAEGKLHPLDALDLMSSPTASLRQAEAEVPKHRLRHRARTDK